MHDRIKPGKTPVEIELQGYDMEQDHEGNEKNDGSEQSFFPNGDHLKIIAWHFEVYEEHLFAVSEYQRGNPIEKCFEVKTQNAIH